MFFETETGPLEVEIARLTVAGWTGRDRTAVDHHIDELKALGVAPPSTVPLFYQVSPTLLTHAPDITVLGGGSSGEVEPFVLGAAGKLWLGVGSDHTDRDLEAHSVAHSKQICAKPVGRRLWSLDLVIDRLDGLQLRSWISTGEQDREEPYQDGTLASLLPLTELLQRHPLADGEAMLCGTLSAIGGVRPAARFRMALHDPANGATIDAAYRTACLDVIS